MKLNAKELKSKMDNLKNQLDTITESVENQFDYLESLSNFSKIINYKPINLSNISIESKETNSFSPSKKILIKLNKASMNEIEELYSEEISNMGIKKMYNSDVYTVDINANTSKEEANSYLKIFDLIGDLDKENHIFNMEAQESNLKLKESLFMLLKEVGISESYYDYKTSRSRNRTKINYNFKMEIGKQIPTNYPSDNLERILKDKKTNFLKIHEDLLKDIEKSKQLEIESKKLLEESKLSKIELMKKGVLLDKYELDLDCEWEDLLETIILEDQYLYLAHYLSLNRGDWTEGHSYASQGIENFVIRDDEDQKIYDDIVGLMYENWDFDGRVFRDCEYNYDVLKDMVNKRHPDLINDYTFVNEKILRY